MRQTMALAGTSIIAGLATVILSTGVAQACSSPVTTPVLLGSLNLTKTGVDGQSVSARLSCFRGLDATDPTSVEGVGSVTDPNAACRELATAGGDFTALNVHPTWLATALAAPVSVTADGHWGTAPVGYAQTFGNPSALAKKTGDVFQF